MGLSKTEISVCTAASSSAEEMSQRSLDVTTSGGTPLSKMLLCCLPFGPQDEAEFPPLEENEARGLPPIVIAEFKPDPETKTVFDDVVLPVQEEETRLFDAGLVFQMAILGGVLIGQAFNVV
jgi:hypothetical protein